MTELTFLPRYETPEQREEAVKAFLTATKANYGMDTALRLVKEEMAEVQEALEHLLKELIDLEYVVQGMGIVGDRDKVQVEVDQATYDKLQGLLRYVNVFHPFVLEEAFRRVHTSNMSKLVNGTALFREDGKILKGPNYAPANLEGLV